MSAEQISPKRAPQRTGEVNPVSTSARLPLNTWISWAGRLTLGVLFAWAAMAKLEDPQGFATDIGNYQMLGEPVLGFMAVGLPAFELAVAVTLLVTPLHRGSALITGAMLWIFAIAMVQAKARGIDLDCGCFGSEAPVSVGLPTIIRNVGLGLWALWIAFRHQPPATAS